MPGTWCGLLLQNSIDFLEIHVFIILYLLSFQYFMAEAIEHLKKDLKLPGYPQHYLNDIDHSKYEYKSYSLL